MTTNNTANKYSIIFFTFGFLIIKNTKVKKIIEYLLAVLLVATAVIIVVD